MNKSNNVISPSSSTTRYSTHTIIGGMHRSGSNRSLFLRETSTSMKLTHSTSRQSVDQETARNLSVDYQEIQKRTLTKWVNAQLTDDHIKNMESDLRDGKRLLKLLSVVSKKEPAPKPERGNMRIHQLSNVAQALKFLQNQLGEVPDIGNEAIVNGDLKMTLALISFIMLKYHLQLVVDDKSIMASIEHDNELIVSPSISAPSTPLPSTKPSLLSSAAHRALRNTALASEKTSSATEAKLGLLRWVRIQLNDYVQANIIPSIQDFSRSWRNGVAFCLLLHRHDPNLVPQLFDPYLRNASTWTKETWHALLTMAFTVGEEQLSIPRYLEPEDLIDVDYPHEPSVMMYVTEFYKIMSCHRIESHAPLRQACIADLLKFLGIHHAGPLIEEKEDESVPIAWTAQKEEEDDETPITPNDPALDALISDRDTLASFIKSISPAIEAMTQDEMTSADSVSQRLFAFDAIREQANGQQTLLDSVNAKQQQLNQEEAASIYQDLERRWHDFVGLMDSTATQLRTIQSDWQEGEEDVKRFQQTAASVEKQIQSMREALDDAYPAIIKKAADQSDVAYPLQPLEEGASHESANEYETSVAGIVSSAQTFQPAWESFEQLETELSLPAKRIVSPQFTRLRQKYEGLVAATARSKEDCDRYKRGVSFADITGAVNDELEIVRKTLNDTKKVVTDDAIQDLEKRVEVAQSTLKAVFEEYHDLLDGDEYYGGHLQKIQAKSETVSDWVNQVRVWFIEAERIRKWIGERIDIIEQRDCLTQDVDPLTMHLSLDAQIKQWHDEHQQLREEIEKFDAADMTRLRTHVKTLTGVKREKDLSPADTSTIEITLTTLNMLNTLKELLNSRSFLLDMLMLRIQWENLFSEAVAWVATTDKEMNSFLRKNARYSERTDVEEVIQTLVYLERKIAQFDQADYSNVLDAYQEMDELNHSGNDAPLPDYLEKRQEGFEKAFEDLMKRCAFCRKVVEQHLKVMEVVGQFRKIKEQGESLRHAMLENNHSMAEEEMYVEHVQKFKEQSAYLITHFAAQVPYPLAPDMNTAIGTGDRQDNELANEQIRSTISTYGMSLALLAEGLDQLLASRQYILSLHQRSKVAYDKMARLTAWMDERIRTLNKTKIDIKNQKTLDEMEEEEVMRLEKERDGIQTRLAQIEEEDLANILQEVRQLEDDVDASNAVSIDRHSLVSGIEGLEMAHQQLQKLLTMRAVDLDMSKRYMAWQTMHNKSNHMILTVGRKIWDVCIKKARFDPSREDIDKPSYAHDNENTQALQLLQDRVAEIGDRHMSALTDMHEQLIDTDLDTTVLNDKQTHVEQKYADLQHLLTYTNELMTQRSIITEFLLRVQDAQRDGEKIRDAIAKMTRRIMESQDVDLSRADQFHQTIDAIWQECGQSMPYPTYNGSGLLRSLQPTETANYNAQIKAQIKALIDRKMDELQALKESIDQLLETYRQANHTKTLTGQYDDEAAELQAWIDEQAGQLKQQHIDITADNATFATVTDEVMHALESKHGALVNTLQEFETIRLKQLHDKVAHLMENTTIKSVDITQPVRRLGQVMSNLEQLKDSLADHRITMEAANKRILWQKKLQSGREQLEHMSEQLRTFHTNKNKCIAQESFNHQHVEQLEKEWDDLIQQKNVFTTETLPMIEQSYDTFVAYFAKLARPIATPDHIEAWMESLNRATNRFEENLGARSKELDLVRQRLSFDDQLHGVMLWLQQHQQHVDQFIEDRERWNDKDTLRDVWTDLNQQYQTHSDNVIHGLLNDLNELREASHGANMTLVSDPLTTKIAQLDHMQHRIQLDLTFAEGIVTQRCLMNEFLDRMTALEQSAEQIREAIASAANEGTFDRVQALRSECDTTDRDMSTQMPYPTRDTPSTQQQVKDDAMNSLVRDTIETKSKRLANLLDGLEELLASKENVSRRKMAVEGYRKEFKACMDWIETRQSMLETARTHIPSNMPGLRDGISLTDSVQSTSQAPENPMTTLKNAYEKCQRVEEFPQEQSVAEKAWTNLLEDAAHTREQLLAALVPAEIQERAQKLLRTLQDLQDEISQAETATVTDDQISQWQKQVDELESRDYEQLQKDASNQTDNDVKGQLDRVAESAVRVRTSITTLYDAVNKSRLQKTHGDNADVVQARLKEVCALIHAAQGHSEAHDVDQVKQQYQQLVMAHKEMLAQMDDCKEAYNDLVSYYNFIKSQIDVDSATEQRQAAIDAQWSELESANDNLQQSVQHMAKSVDCHQTLARLQNDLASIKKDIDAFDVARGESVLDTAARRLQSIVHGLGELANSIDDEYFLRQHDKVMQDVKVIDEDIEKCRVLCIRQSALDAFKQQAKEIERGCEDQLVKIRSGVPENTESYGRLLNAAKVELDGYDVNGSFAQQCKQLVEEFQVDEKTVQEVQQPVIAAIEKLNGTIKNEEAYLEFMKQYAKHTKSSTALRGSLDALKSTITGANSNATETSMLIADMEKSIEESLQTLEAQGGDLASLVEKEDKRCRKMQKKADDRYISLKNEYHQLKLVISETLARMEKQRKHREVSTKLTETMRYVEKLKDRASALQMLSEDKSIITVEQEELQELEQEVAKIASLDTLFADIPDTDKLLKSQRASLKQSISTLQDLLAIRRSETQGNIGEFMQIVDRLEKQAGLLQTAIDDAAPHHAAVVNNKFSKTDLQSLLRNLVASYKTYEPKMTQLVKKAKTEAERHSDDLRVSERLTRVLARCNKIKSAAAARERELQTCISQLDHEFFTKLAMAKSTPRKTAKKTGLPPLPATPVPMSRGSSSQSSSASATRKSRVPMQRPSKTPIPSRSVSRTRYVADPKNELDMELGRIVNENVYKVKVKMVPGEVGKYWFGEVNPRLVYCRILPSKLVMVRVGGGWVELSKFLRDHKLNEGSIRASTADDTISSTSSSGSSGGSSSTSTPFQSSLAPTTRCVSPSGRITVRGGGVSATSSSDNNSMLATTWSSSSRRSSKTPRGGFVEGDKYIRVDEAGNQLMVKMTKAEDGAKMPIVTRRRA